MLHARQIAALLAGLLAVTTIAAGLGAAPAARAASAAVTQDAVIPPDPAPAAIDDSIVAAGATGFLHQYNFLSQYLWTSYATGQAMPVAALSGLNPAYIVPAGGDVVSFVVEPPSNPAGDVSEFDLASMTWQHWALPVNDGTLGVLGVFGSHALVAARPAGGVPTWQVVTFNQDGTDTVTAVTGLPAGADIAFAQPHLGDASAALVRYSVNGTLQYGLLDLATAVVTPIPDPDPSYQDLVLSSDSIGLYDTATGTVRVYPRAGLGPDTAAQTVTLPASSAVYQIALAGDHVVAVNATRECQYCAYTVDPAADIPLSGAQPGQALPQAQTGTGAIAQAPGGAALLVGGTGPADWSVRRFTADSGDNLASTAVLPLTGPLTNAGLTISQGLVRHIEAQPTPGGPPNYLMFNHMLAADTTNYSIDPQVNGGTLANALPCASGASCVRTVDGNWYGTSFLLTSGSAGSVLLREQIQANTSTVTTSLPSAAGTIVDASLGYAIVDGTNPAAQYVVHVGYTTPVSSGPVTGAALWFDTLWRSDGAGYLQATNLDTKVTSPRIATGANCAASEIQATQRWIYWSCGASGPAGVYDLSNHADVPVPAGPMLLGDGYLLQHDPATGDLDMYDLHTDAASGPVTLANVPLGPVPDDRNVTWAVDKYSGDVAYVAADGSVHVVSAGVPSTPPAIGDPPASWFSGQVYFGTNGTWRQGLALTRPVTSWTLTIRRYGTGQVVDTESGGAARVGLVVSWNGLLANGAKAYSGPYDWSLSVTTPDVSTPFTVPGSTLVAECGQIPFRSYDCDGMPALLADKGGYTGESYWYNGTLTGGLRSNGYTDNWPLCPSVRCVSAIVPFGDFNGDGFADVLVRYRSGVLRAYLGFGQSYFSTQTVKSIKIGTGWNNYNALAYPGDLTRDGKPDLVARDSNGRLWLFAGTGKGSFRRRVLISQGWGRYTRLIGAGDLTGDGNGDLLAIGKYGVMWRFNGNGHGGFGPRHYVSTGWSRYNAVIGVGDLLINGCNDLVARDRLGTLWRFNGNCRGGFASRVKISSGWGKYQRLF